MAKLKLISLKVVKLASNWTNIGDRMRVKVDGETVFPRTEIEEGTTAQINAEVSFSQRATIEVEKQNGTRWRPKGKLVVAVANGPVEDWVFTGPESHRPGTYILKYQVTA